MKISVVMATYNGEKYLDRQIQSILTQTLQPDEIIVCDDASTDGTVAILERYRQQGKLTYLVNDNRLGFIGNFKKAVALANATNYVALCDQDDEWLPNKLEISAALLEKINDDEVPCLVYTDLALVDQDEKALNNSFQNELGQDKYKHNLQTLLFGNFVTGCTTIMNPKLKRFFEEIPDDARFHDEWMALIAFTFGKAEGIALPLVRHLKHENNASIKPGTKPRNRYRSTFNQLITALKGKDDFLCEQIKMVQRFYNKYAIEMKPGIKSIFEQFLTLQHRSYFIKKLAYRRTVRKYRI